MIETRAVDACGGAGIDQRRELSGAMGTFCMLTGVFVTWAYLFVETRQLVHFTVDAFYLCKKENNKNSVLSGSVGIPVGNMWARHPCSLRSSGRISQRK